MSPLASDQAFRFCGMKKDSSQTAIPLISCRSLALNMDSLPDDLLAHILGRLEPMHRHVAAGTSARLLALAQPTFHALALALPPTPLGGAGSAMAAQAPASLRQNLAALPHGRFDNICQVQLFLPEATNRRQARAVEEPCQPLNAWLASYLSTGKAAAAMRSLIVRPAPPAPPEASAHSTLLISGHSCPGATTFKVARTVDYQSRSLEPESPLTVALTRQNSEDGSSGSPTARHQPSTVIASSSPPMRLAACDQGAMVGGRALALLSSHCPSLEHLSVPLLAPGAAAVLPSLAPHLTTFSCAIQDSALLDHVFQLRGLKSLHLSLHTNLLSCTLHQQQLMALQQITGLKSLHLEGILLPDSDAAWRYMPADLAELHLSAPFHAKHLQHVHNLCILQYPTFSAGGVHHLSLLTSLRELHCRQAIDEGGMLTLAQLTQLTALQVDSISLPHVEALAQAPATTATRPEIPAIPQAPAMVVGMPIMVTEPASAPGVDPWAPAAIPTPRPPPHPAAALATHYSGLGLPTVTHLVLTGVYTYRGELGALFPNLTACAIAAVRMPEVLPPASVPVPKLQRLSIPVCEAIPQLLIAAPALTSLTLVGVTSGTVLEEALGHVPKSKAVSVPCPVPACRLSHLTLVIQSSGVRTLQASRLLRAALITALASPPCLALRSLCLKDTPTPGTAAPNARYSGFDSQTVAIMHHASSASSHASCPLLRDFLSMDQRDGHQDVISTGSGRRTCITPLHPHTVNKEWAMAVTATTLRPAPHHDESSVYWQKATSKQHTTSTGRRSLDGCSTAAGGALGGYRVAVDPSTLAAAGRAVDEHVLTAAVTGAAATLRVLRVIGAGSLTSTGLSTVLRNSSSMLERVFIVGCPRTRPGAVEQLGETLGRPWLNVAWSP